MSVATASSTNSGSINTKKVEDRRPVCYETLADFLNEAERLATTKVRTVGNWSQGQIYEHLARSFDVAIDGMKPFPAPLRFVMSLLFKNKFLSKAIPPGFKTTPDMIPDAISVEDALASLRKAVARQSETSERAFHAGFGKISNEEWDMFNLRHAEMHMSFIVPDEQA